MASGQCRDEHGGRRRGRRRAERKNEKKRERGREGAFPRRDSRTGARHPAVSTDLSHASLSLSRLSTYLPPTLARFRACAPSAPLPPPTPTVPRAPGNVVAATPATPIVFLVARGHERAHPCAPRERSGVTTRRIGTEHGGVGHIWRPMADLDNTPNEQRSLSMLNIRKVCPLGGDTAREDSVMRILFGESGSDGGFLRRVRESSSYARSPWIISPSVFLPLCYPPGV